ncbi:MAG: MarR family transcriptional regulator [Chloroflexota bacterium]
MKHADPFLTTLHEFRTVFMRHSMHHALRHSRGSGCSMSQLGTLMIIHRRGTRTVSDIGEELGVSNAAASQMLDRLVQEGLIFRTEDPDDRRVKQIKLTDQGSQRLQESIEARHSWLKEIALELSDPEKEKITQALHILIEKARILGHEDQNESQRENDL